MENISYFKIGLFVIAAIAIGLVGVVMLGGGKFFQKKNIIETYLDESVQGLDVGSPVKFRGVQVGNVEEISLTAVEYATQRRYVVVRAGITRNVFQFPISDPANPVFTAEIQRGLRVRLAPQGLTGQAYLEADYLDPAQNPPLEIDWQPYYPYVPSARSRFTQFAETAERILRNVEQIDIQRLVATMENSLNTIDKLVSGVNFDTFGVQVSTLLSELRETNRQLRQVVAAPELKSAVTDAAAAASGARQIIERADKPLTQLLTDLPRASDSINRMLTRFDSVTADLPQTTAQLLQTLRQLNRLINSQQQQIQATLENIRAVTENVKDFADESRKYPSQVIFGAPPPRSEVFGR
jgi:phospholipid/cholesterol/gamma-HCH transport system substrate-binding protein/paraquat-inducible protein B